MSPGGAPLGQGGNPQGMGALLLGTLDFCLMPYTAEVIAVPFNLPCLQLQKEVSPRRGGGLVCDQNESSRRPFTSQGNLHVPRSMGSRSYSDSDTIQFDDRSLSKLKESDRCSATENLFLESLSLDSPEEPDEHRSRQLEREKFLTGLTEVRAILHFIMLSCYLLCQNWYSFPAVGSEILCHRHCLRIPSSEFGMDKFPFFVMS